MKKIIPPFLQRILLLLALVSIVACVTEREQNLEPEDSKPVYLSFATDSLFEQKMMRATIQGTVRENQVQTLTLLFFDRTTGQRKTGTTNPLTFNVVSPTPSQWLNNDPATHTVKLPFGSTQASNLAIYAFANLPSTVAHLSSVNTTADLNNLAITSTFESLNPNSTGAGVVMNGSIVTTTDSVSDNIVYVRLKRAVAKVNVVLHFGYSELVKNEPFNYQYKNFKQQLHVLPNITIGNRIDSTLNGVLRTPTQFDRKQDTLTLGPFFINAYDISTTPAVEAPYVALDFKARRELPNGTTPPIGWLPPPAGGDYSSNGYVERRHYYRLVMPRTIQHNTHYIIHAYFIAEGGYDPAGAQIVKIRTQVGDWHAGTVAPVVIY